ncbi:MAG: uroporphyrinogen-III synthase [Acidimicrobiia bacterium]|nr:uroporphyrinogen-III synthase [Acidimicrobiia bacterium]
MKRVAVTTSADRAQAAAMPFTFLGLQTVLLPCIGVESSAEPELEAVRAIALLTDLLVVSSKRTIDILWPEGPLPAVDFAVVGAATARAVQARGGRAAMIGTGGSAQLVEMLAPHVTGRSVAWPHGRGADPRPLQQLAGHAREFSAPIIYTSVPLAPPSDPVDVITFASPSAVSGWQLSRPLDKPVAAIGESTRLAVNRTGTSATIVAEAPTFQSLAEAVAKHLGVAA